MEKIYINEEAFRKATHISLKEKFLLFFKPKQYQIDAFNRTILTYKILKGKIFVLDFSKLSILFMCFLLIGCSKPIVKEKKTITIQHSFNRHCISRCDAG